MLWKKKKTSVCTCQGVKNAPYMKLGVLNHYLCQLWVYEFAPDVRQFVMSFRGFCFKWIVNREHILNCRKFVYFLYVNCTKRKYYNRQNVRSSHFFSVSIYDASISPYFCFDCYTPYLRRVFSSAWCIQLICETTHLTEQKLHKDFKIAFEIWWIQTDCNKFHAYCSYKKKEWNVVLDIQEIIKTNL